MNEQTSVIAEDREEIVEELAHYGIQGKHVYLLDMIPLIEMIWADGEKQDGELAVLDHYLVRHVEKLNQAAGYEIISLDSAEAFIARFLQERPDPAYLRRLRNFLPSLRLVSPDPAENQAVQEFILAGCLDIASACVTRYPYELDDRFDAGEKKCFFEILRTLKFE